MCSFIAQLAEHRTGVAEVTGSTHIEALIILGLLLLNCLNWKIYCDDHSLSFLFDRAGRVFVFFVFVFFWQLLADVDLLYFHRGQPQHRELHALLFSNNVWVL